MSEFECPFHSGFPEFPTVAGNHSSQTPPLKTVEGLPSD